MPAYKVTCIRKTTASKAEVGMNVEVFCDNPDIYGTGKLLSEAFERKYGFPIPGIDNNTIINQTASRSAAGNFEIEEL